MKKGHKGNYFEKTLTDSTTKVSLVSFNAGQQKSIKQFMDLKEALQLSDCEVERASGLTNMKIMLKGNTAIMIWYVIICQNSWALRSTVLFIVIGLYSTGTAKLGLLMEYSLGSFM